MEAVKNGLKKFFGKKEPENDFSAFFNDASAEAKKKLFKDVIRKANKDQKELIQNYKENTATKTT